MKSFLFFSIYSDFSFIEVKFVILCNVNIKSITEACLKSLVIDKSNNFIVKKIGDIGNKYVKLVFEACAQEDSMNIVCDYLFVIALNHIS